MTKKHASKTMVKAKTSSQSESETSIEILLSQPDNLLYDSMKEKTEYLNQIREKSKREEPNRSSILPQEDALIIIKDICKKYGFEKNVDAIFAVGVLCQLGGTSQNCDGNLSYPVGKSHPKLKEIKEILKSRSQKKGIRKFAKRFATEIAELMLAINMPGNLYKKIQKIHPSRRFSTTEKVWMSDFLVETEQIPDEIRALVIESFTKQSTQKLGSTGKSKRKRK